MNVAGAKAGLQTFLNEAEQLDDVFAQAAAYENLMQVAFYEMDLDQALYLGERCLYFGDIAPAQLATTNAIICLIEIGLMRHDRALARANLARCRERNLRYGLPHTHTHVGTGDALSAASGRAYLVCQLAQQLYQMA